MRIINLQYLTSFMFIWSAFILQLTFIKYIDIFFIPVNIVFITIIVLAITNNIKVGIFTGIIGGLILDVALFNTYGLNTIIGFWLGYISSLIGEKI